jgi:hypothetical protein
MFALMFEAASKTVRILSRDKKWLGGTPAVTVVLHTWTRELTFHPHVHAIVSAGALNKEGEWVESRKDYLFPVKVMARLFRRLFREAMLKAIGAGQVTVLAEHDAPMRRALFETKWNVYTKAPFGGAEQVYSYLGRYTHRVGISNARILRADDQRVEFATKNGRTCSLAPVEFLHRMLLHVLPKGNLDAGRTTLIRSAPGRTGLLPAYFAAICSQPYDAFVRPSASPAVAARYPSACSCAASGRSTFPLPSDSQMMATSPCLPATSHVDRAPAILGW